MNKKNNNIDYFNLNLESNQVRSLLIIVIILVIILLFRKLYTNFSERIIVFSILFILFLIISKNLVITIIGSSIIFLLVNLIIKYRNTIENFQDGDEKKSSEGVFDKSIFEGNDFKKSADGIKNLLEKINGGIELKDEDKKETPSLGIDLNKYSDDNKPNPLKQAQKEAYELIDTVNALKDTVNTLAPVLMEGKKLMGIFENLKI
jgi:hypothetical protein